MKNTFYSLPLKCEILTKKNSEVEHPLCNFDESIAKNIFLLITARFGEHRYNKTLGCEIWSSDFQLIGNVNVWKEKIRKSVETVIQNHEKRLKNLIVSLDLSEEEIKSPISNLVSIKKRLQIKIKGKTISTGEDFSFETKFFISPLSLD